MTTLSSDIFARIHISCGHAGITSGTEKPFSISRNNKILVDSEYVAKIDVVISPFETSNPKVIEQVVDGISRYIGDSKVEKFIFDLEDRHASEFLKFLLSSGMFSSLSKRMVICFNSKSAASNIEESTFISLIKAFEYKIEIYLNYREKKTLMPRNLINSLSTLLTIGQEIKEVKVMKGFPWDDICKDNFFCHIKIDNEVDKTLIESSDAFLMFETLGASKILPRAQNLRYPRLLNCFNSQILELVIDLEQTPLKYALGKFDVANLKVTGLEVDVLQNFLIMNQKAITYRLSYTVRYSLCFIKLLSAGFVRNQKTPRVSMNFLKFRGNTQSKFLSEQLIQFLACTNLCMKLPSTNWNFFSMEVVE